MRMRSVLLLDRAKSYVRNKMQQRRANNESSEVIDILLPVTFYFNRSTRLDNVKNI